MEAVQIRQRGAEDFAAYYESLCALQDICPVASIRAGVKEGVLNCHVRRLKSDDWHPVLTALKINKVLHTIVFYEKWEERLYPAIKNLAADEALQRYCAKQPSRVSMTTDKQTTLSIAKTLQECLSISSAVTSLALEGIPFTYKDCKTLAKGLSKNHSISHLSFKGSAIGDRATGVICDVFRDSHSLEWLDLTACSLTSQGTSAVANVIKHQCIQCQSAAWKDSLRFHQPRLGQMPGLRRVTLNLNTEVGDKGARELADTLRDDVCLKALDLQSCGVTTDGARHFVEVLKLNSCLMVLDVRANALIDDDVVDVIHEQLAINVTGMDRSEESYVWLDVEVERIFNDIKLTQAPPPSMKGSKSRNSRTSRSLQTRRSYNAHSGQRRGNPWRTGSPSGQRRGIPWRASARSYQRWKIINAPSISVKTHSASNEQTSDSSTPSRERVALKAELSTCYRRLKEEIRSRAKAEAYIVELLEQNRNLSEQLKTMEDKLASSSDDQMIEAVEATFKQFSAFLDLLQDKGLGELCALLPNSGMDMKLMDCKRT